MLNAELWHSENQAGIGIVGTVSRSFRNHFPAVKTAQQGKKVIRFPVKKLLNLPDLAGQLGNGSFFSCQVHIALPGFDAKYHIFSPAEQGMRIATALRASQ